MIICSTVCLMEKNSKVAKVFRVVTQLKFLSDTHMFLSDKLR